MTKTKKLNDTVVLMGLCGKARSGKDTVASIAMNHMADADAEEAWDWVVAKESFAAPIKSMVAMLLDFFGIASIMNREEMSVYLDGDAKENKIDAIGASPRELMQTLGAEWGRDIINPNIWLTCIANRLPNYEEAAKHGHKGAMIFVTDVRFDNEAEIIRNLGGTIVQIDSGARKLEDVERCHSSEGGVSPHLIDVTIDNSGSIEELSDKVRVLLENLMGITLYLPEEEG